MFASFFRAASMIAFTSLASAAFAQEIGRPIEAMPQGPQGFSAPTQPTITMPNTGTTLSPIELPSSAPGTTVVLPPPPEKATESDQPDAPRCWCHMVNPGNNSVERTKCGPECCHGDSADDGC
jgi:hypothetical protein